MGTKTFNFIKWSKSIRDIIAPKKRPLIRGLIVCVSMSNDGVLSAVGASLKNTVNGTL